MPATDLSTVEAKSWWTTLPGAIAALGTLVTAATGGIISVQRAIHPADAAQTQKIEALQTENTRLADENARWRAQGGLPAISWSGKNFDSASLSVDSCKARAGNEALKQGGTIVQQGDTWVSLALKGDTVIVECQAGKSGYVLAAGPNPLDPNLGSSLAESIFP